MSTKTFYKKDIFPGGGYSETDIHCQGNDTPSGSPVRTENSYTASYIFRRNDDITYKKGSVGYPTLNGNVSFCSGGFKFHAFPSAPSNIKALSNLLEKFKQSDFNLAVSAGESHESWRMISDRMLGFAEALKQVKRGNLRGALRAMGSTARPSSRAKRKLNSGDVSGSFLELSYGWMPMMRDIYAAAEVINKPYVSKPSLRTSDRVNGSDYVMNYSSLQSHCHTLIDERVIYHIARLSTKEVSMAVRLGLTNPLSILWELTTLSFVADWFLPISDLIQAVEATYVIPVGKYIRSDVTRSHVLVQLPANTLIPAQGAFALTVGAGVQSNKTVLMTRTISPALPTDIYSNAGPRQSLIDLDLSLSQVASASALLHQAFRSFVGKRS